MLRAPWRLLLRRHRRVDSRLCGQGDQRGTLKETTTGCCSAGRPSQRPQAAGRQLCRCHRRPQHRPARSSDRARQAARPPLVLATASYRLYADAIASAGVDDVSAQVGDRPRRAPALADRGARTPMAEAKRDDCRLCRGIRPQGKHGTSLLLGPRVGCPAFPCRTSAPSILTAARAHRQDRGWAIEIGGGCNAAPERLPSLLSIRSSSHC